MVDDIIEAAIDILGDVLEAVWSSRRAKKKKAKQPKAAKDTDPWDRPVPTPPWEK